MVGFSRKAICFEISLERDATRSRLIAAMTTKMYFGKYPVQDEREAIWRPKN